MQKSFKNAKHNGVQFKFPNGNWISTIWGFGSYTEEGMSDIWYSGIKAMHTFTESNDVEIMIECGEKLKKRIHKKYEGDGSVIGYLNIIQWLEIVNLLAKEKNIS